MARRPWPERFWEKVPDQPGDDCWEWAASLRRGYGQLTITNGKVELAHRLSYRLCRGKIPPGMFVCHHCDNPKCVNPSHLFLGTVKDNIADSMAKGLRYGPPRVERCKRGHPMSEKNTYEFRKRSGKTGRACRACRRLWKQAARPQINAARIAARRAAKLAKLQFRSSPLADN